MQKMSGLDLQFAVSELAHLQGKRIARIRKTENGIYLFKIGGEEILFECGVRLHLTRQALAAAGKPDGFVGFLRKNFEGKTAAGISQVPNERIVEITAKSTQSFGEPNDLSTSRTTNSASPSGPFAGSPANRTHRSTVSKEKLVFELFRAGNLIAVGEDGVIAACLQRDDAGGRIVARGEKYSYPKATPFEFKVPGKVAFCVQENEGGEPVSYSNDAARGGREFPTISEALDYYHANQKSETESERVAKGRIEGLEKRLKSQEDELERLGVEKTRAKAAGDAVWAHFEEYGALCLLVKEMKKAGRGESEINAELAKRGARLVGAEIEIEA